MNEWNLTSTIPLDPAPIDIWVGDVVRLYIKKECGFHMVNMKVKLSLCLT